MHLDIRNQLLSNPWFIMGALGALFFALLALLGPGLCPHDPGDISFEPLLSPTASHWLGTNDGGQDILAGLLSAVRASAAFGLMAGLAGVLLGVGVGLASGWYGGVVDQFLMRVSDMILAVPSVMILILTAALFQPPPWLLALILAGMSWPTTAKAIRAQTLSLKRSLHVRAAVNMGAGGAYILWRHLLPEMFPLYVIGFAAKARMAFFMEATLSFLGLIDPARKSLGSMISFALKYYYLDIWWNWLAPAVACLSLIIMSVTFLAVGMERVLDPRLRNLLPQGGA